MTAATGTTTLLPTGRPWIADAARRLVTRRWSTAAVVRVLLAVFVLAAAGVALDGDSRGAPTRSPRRTTTRASPRGWRPGSSVPESRSSTRP